MVAIRFSALLAALALSACGGATPEPPEAAARAESACEQRVFEGSRFTACRYDTNRHDLVLFLGDDQGPFRSFPRLAAHLGERTQRLRFAMNAGMFGEDGRPIGLYVEEGIERRAANRRAGGGNFHLLPNGIFTVDGRGRTAVVPTADYRPDLHPRWASQSGPMLVIAGRLHPRISENGDSLNIRNGVGVPDPDSAWFVISDDPVSFGRMARFFRDVLDCPNALYFDGSVSGLWDPAAERQDGTPPIGPIVAVFAREGS